jgi:hypothetical protein
MGLTKSEVEHMTIGNYMDLFDAYKEIYNMEKDNRMLYIIPDRLDRTTSMRDL